MEDSKLTNTEKIDRLKQKLATYKQTLETLKAGDVVEDYLLMKNEDKAIKKQIFALEGEVKTMKETQGFQLTEYEKRVEIISVQVESIKESLGQLEDDVKLLINTVDNLNFQDLVIKLENLINTHNQPSKTEELTEISKLKEEIEQLKKQIHHREEVVEADRKITVSKLQPSGYKKLMNMIQSTKTIDSSFHPPRKMLTSQTNPLQKYRQFNPTEIIRIERVRNQNNMKTSVSPKYQVAKPSKYTLKKNKKRNDKIALNTHPDYPQRVNEVEFKEKEFNDQVKKERSKINQNLARSTLNETIEPTNNVSEVSTTNQKEMEEKAYPTLIEQGSKPETNETTLVNSETEQSTSKPEETKQISSGGGSEKKTEERPSFFSFLQRGKNDGK
ncbi:hypothetical protein [Metabacillus litoralis]|jgi:hypothetical protein|uniref:hypothetical protein n=1 Tax=Metabacillus litoralis TaxID=152268 RepID=UPI00204222D8|nr:hypothetical protein [Metabacillus litoralis]MCM3654504.1 hypothetical protein [Metabacillus litoralis]